MLPLSHKPVVLRMDEGQRLKALQETQLLDSERESAFDELVELAAAVCEMPISLVSLVDAERQWFKARVGIDVEETSRDISFCAHVIEQEDLFIIPDARNDPRFAQNPLVTGDLGVRFYAGVPLQTDAGENLGSLCVIDRQPRELSALQQKTLRVLGRQVMAQIKTRNQVRALAAEMSERESMAARLKASETLFRAFMDANPAAAFMKDEAGRMLYCNRALTGRYAAKPADWIGKSDQEIWPGEFASKYREADLEVLRGDKIVHFVDESPGSHGRTLIWDVYKFPVSDAGGNRFLGGIAMDVTHERTVEAELRCSQQKLRELNMKLEKLSTTDGLTHINNRRGLEECLEREYVRSRQTNAPLSLLMLDVDHFKLFNDSFGHVSGDQVLQRIAVLMQQYTRDSDILARYGGEEFIALLPDTAEKEAYAIASRLCEQVAADHWKHRLVTVSVGVGQLQPQLASPSAFVNAIDEALYAAKRGGRNQVCLAAAAQTVSVAP